MPKLYGPGSTSLMAVLIADQYEGQEGPGRDRGRVPGPQGGAEGTRIKDNGAPGIYYIKNRSLEPFSLTPQPPLLHNISFPRIWNCEVDKVGPLAAGKKRW